MADCFANVPITDHTGMPRTLAWLREKYGNNVVVTTTAGWRVARVWEQSAAMTAGVRVFRGREPYDGFLARIGWPGMSISVAAKPAEQLGERSAWIDVPLHGGHYDPSLGERGPMYIVAADGSWEYRGIGWRSGTNHDHLNIDLVYDEAEVQEPQPPPPPTVDYEELARLIEQAVTTLQRVSELLRRGR